MIDITPETGSRQEVNVGDTVRITWRLDAQVARADLTFTAKDTLGGTLATYSGSDLSETEVQVDGAVRYEYATEHVLRKPREMYEFALDDGIQTAVDTARLYAQNRLT